MTTSEGTRQIHFAAVSEALSKRKRSAWVPAIAGVLAIAVESTGGMGAGHTKAALLHLVNLFYVQGDTQAFEQVHHLLRKAGHLFGYGLLGLLLARAWSTQIDRRAHPTRVFSWSSLRLRGCSLGVASAFLVGCADELHQSFTPGRTALFSDVLIDTAGALAINSVVLLWLTLQRPQGVLWRARMRYEIERYTGFGWWKPGPGVPDENGSDI